MIKQLTTCLLFMLFTASLTAQSTSAEIKEAQRRANTASLEEHERSYKRGMESIDADATAFKEKMNKSITDNILLIYKFLKTDELNKRNSDWDNTAWRKSETVTGLRNDIYKDESVLNEFTDKYQNLKFENPDINSPLAVFKEFQDLLVTKECERLFHLYDPYNDLSEGDKTFRMASLISLFNEQLQILFHDSIMLEEPTIDNSLATMKYITGENQTYEMGFVQRNGKWFLSSIIGKAKK